MPAARSLTARESAGVQYMLLLRHQTHASPLYTSRRTSLHDPTAPCKLYGQAQMNAHYGVRTKASLDPFTAVQTYSQKFVREERALPDWSARPVCRELFPAELLDTVEPDDGVGMRKKRKLELSTVSALPNAEEAFGMPSLDPEAAGRNLLDKLDAMRDDDADDAADPDNPDALEDEDQDEAYDDEDAGDYDAEIYFENGDEGGDDDGDGDDGEATY